MTPFESRLGDETVEVMHQIATMLLVSRELRVMAKSFANSPDLDKRAAEPHAIAILVFVSKVSASLLKAVFRSRSRRLSALEKARKNAIRKMDEVIASARILADMEQNAFQGTTVPGDVISRTVLAPLLRLQADWQTAERG